MSYMSYKKKIMKLRTYAEESYKWANLTHRHIFRLPKRLDDWLWHHSHQNGVDKSVVVRYALEKYAKNDGDYDPQHEL